jgi:DNA-binding GntR family transcriptional regulator
MFTKNGIPLYYQLKEYLLKDIKENYKPGEMLPSEGEIERQYKVSRITVRKAIEELSRDGIVLKQQGRGTFVQEQKISYDANIIGSLTQRLEKQDHKLQTKSIEYNIITDEHHVKDILGCDAMLCIKRYRTLDDKPFALMLNYIDISKVPGLQENFNIESLYSFYSQEYGIDFYYAEETVEATSATAAQAQKLNIAQDTPLLSLQRLSYDKEHAATEFSDIVIRADMYKHKIILLPR